MASHALFSPSGAARWLRCPGSVKACEGLEDEGSEYAAEGTLAHELAQAILTGTVRPKHDEEMLEHVSVYTELVSQLVDQAPGAQVFIEQRLQFSESIGVDEQFGTADCVIVEDDRITLVDLKYGRGVRVDAEENPQLQIYGIAALEQFGFAGEFKRVRLIIVQPRVDDGISEWEVSVDELEAFARQVRAAVAEAQGENPPLRPGEKQCRFCKAKATCPALAGHVAEMVGVDFENLDAEAVKAEPARMGANYLAHAMAAVPLIEDWCLAVRARVESELMAGRPVDGYKLVQGRQGPRKWVDADAPVEILDMALGEKAFVVELISPTQAEKALKGSPATWKSLQQHITRSEGKPSVAPISDSRPAISAAALPDEFSNLN